MQTVHDIMTTAVWAVHRDTVVREVEGIFVTHKISGAPLIDDLGNLVGFVSKSDISRFNSTGDDPNHTRVHEIASPKVITTTPTASIEDAAQNMIHEYVHHLVVIEEETMVGMLSAFDFVKLVAKNASEDWFTNKLVSPHEEIVEQIFQDVSNGKVHRAVAVTYTPHTPDQSLR